MPMKINMPVTVNTNSRLNSAIPLTEMQKKPGTIELSERVVYAYILTRNRAIFTLCRFLITCHIK